MHKGTIPGTFACQSFLFDLRKWWFYIPVVENHRSVLSACAAARYLHALSSRLFSSASRILAEHWEGRALNSVLSPLGSQHLGTQHSV